MSSITVFRLGDITCHHYGHDDIVLWQPKHGDRFNKNCVRVSAKKLKRKLKKYLKMRKKVCRKSK